MTDKQKFLKEAVILRDSRKQQNRHILEIFEQSGVKYEVCKLPVGDYSFKMNELDFRLQCAVERKANVNELWGNISRERERFEKEIAAMKNLTGSADLIIEHCPDRDFLQNFTVPNRLTNYQGRKIPDIGRYIYSTLQSWSSANRYGLNIHYMRGKEGTAALLLNIFYYYYHNYHELTKPLRKTE